MRARFRHVLRSLIRRRDFEKGMTDEMRVHLEACADDFERAGLPRHEAMRRARLAFGNLQNARIDSRASRGFGPAELVSRAVDDLRWAARRLASARAFTAAAVITLALGMGVNALMFSVTNGLLLRPLPFDQADRIAWIFADTPGGQIGDTLAGDEGEAIARQMQAFESTAAIGDSALVREIGPRHDRWRGIWTTRGLFSVLGVAPAVGAVPQTLPPEGAPRAIFISHERWVRDFHSDPAIAGRDALFADNKRFTIAGVLPPGLEFPFARAPHRGHGAGFEPGVQDFWILAPDAPGQHPGGAMIARTALGRTIRDAASEVELVSARLATARPEREDGRALRVVSLRDHALGPLRPALPLLQAFAALVLLIACANLGNMLLARASGARGETAMRVALGARTRDLARLFAAEALLLSIGGAAAGLLLAYIGRALLVASGPQYATLLARVRIDGAVVALLALTCVAATFAVALVPALPRVRARLSETSLNARYASHGAARTTRAFIVCQIALSLTLVAGAAALRESLQRLLHVDKGYSTGGVITAATHLYVPPREAVPVLRTLTDRLRAVPGVQAVGFVHSTPLTGKWVVRDTFEILDGPLKGTTPAMPGSFVAYDYFNAMGTLVIAGRTFSEADLTSRAFPILINDVVAREFFPGQNPVGMRVMMTNRVREIAGVVQGTRDLRLDRAPEPQWYQPGLNGSAELVVRVAGDAASSIAAIRREIEAVDPRFVIERIAPLEDTVAATVVERRMAAQLITVFALIALVLAAAGLHGVVAAGVTRRRRELGIRTALGATPRNNLGLVLGEGMRVAFIGVAAGLAGSLLLSDALQALLFETRAANPATLAAAAAVLLAVAAAASAAPAWRASRANPMLALKNDW